MLDLRESSLGHCHISVLPAVQVPQADSDPQPCTKKLKELDERSDIENRILGVPKMTSARLVNSSLPGNGDESKTHAKVPGLRRVPRLKVAHQGIFLAGRP